MQLATAKNTDSLAIVRNPIDVTGFTRPYFGCVPLVVSNAVKAGVRFSIYETARSELSHALPILASSLMLKVITGLSAGGVDSILVATSGEAFKTRVIDTATDAQGIRIATAQMVIKFLRQEGLLTFWRGMSIVGCKQGTTSAVRFSTFYAFNDPFDSFEAL